MGRHTRKVGLALGLCGALTLAVFAAGAAADPFVGPPICSSAGKSLSGTHRNLTIRGNAYVGKRHTLRVRGTLKLARGACLDAFTLGTVHVGKNLVVERGATLALGCTPNSIGPVPPCGTKTTNDTVGGSIIGHHPLTMYLDGNTIGGNVVSIGGGPGLHGQFLNFPIKDNTIGGKLVVRGWHGGWVGAIRDTVGGKLVFSRNGSVQDPDSNEVQTNTVGGDLICWRNSPPAHVNPDDGGLPNTVGGDKIGQCAGL
jgi:hypothetical protein